MQIIYLTRLRILSSMFCFACFFVISAIPGYSQTATASQSSIIDNDPRLKRSVDLDEQGITLKTLLNKISDSKLRLKCMDDAADQKLQIRLIHRPLSLVLTSLSDLLGGYWQPRTDGAGYTFNLTRRTVNFRADWWDLYLLERNKALAQIKANIIDQMQKPVVPRRQDSTLLKQEAGDPELEASSARSQNALGSLSADIKDQIAGTIDITPYYDLHGSYGPSPYEGGVVVAFKELSDDARRIVRNYFPQFSFDDNTQIQFYNNGESITSHVVRANNWWPDAGLTMGAIRRISPNSIAVCWINHSNLVSLVSRMGKDAPREWKKLAEYQGSRVWKNEIPIQNRPVPMLNTAFQLDRLAKRSNIEFIADYYSKFGNLGSFQKAPLAVSPSIQDELNQLVRVNDISWKLIGSKDYLSPATPAGVYLVRNNRWYRDDRLEVPEQILNELYKKLMATLARKLQARSGYPGNTPQLQGLAQSSTATLSAAQNHLKAQLDLETEILEKLSPWQIANGLKWSAFPLASSDSNFSVANIGKQNDDSWSSNWYPFQDIADVIVRQPGTLRFYGSLDANKRQALIEGHLRYTDLTDWQRSHLHTIAPIIAVALNRNVDRELHIGIRNQPSPRMRLGISKLGDIEFAEFVSFYVSDASDSNQPMNEQK